MVLSLIKVSAACKEEVPAHPVPEVTMVKDNRIDQPYLF